MKQQTGRFVVLTHDHPFLHWDLMLEQHGKLRTWRLLAQPVADTIITAEPLPDHRLDYLEYEGPVTGDRGHVARWDAGRFSAMDAGPQHVTCRIAGLRLTGTIELAFSSVGGWSFTYTPEPDGRI